MATRVVEGKKPYTGGKAISIDENKVISLNLRDENNLIIYDSGDDEIYVDLQLPDGIEPTDAFPVGITTGRVLVADDWDVTGTLICAKTTSGDNIKLLYGDDGTLWMDNGTGTFKQIYFKADVDSLLLALRQYIDTELAKKQNGVASATAPENPVEGDLWYDTTNDELKVYDGTNWNATGTGGGSDIEYVTQAEYTALLPGAASDGKHYFIYVNTTPAPRQPGVNTVAYYPLEEDTDDYSGNNRNAISTGGTLTFTTSSDGYSCVNFPGSTYIDYGSQWSSINYGNTGCTIAFWIGDIGNNANPLYYTNGILSGHVASDNNIIIGIASSNNVGGTGNLVFVNKNQAQAVTNSSLYDTNGMHLYTFTTATDGTMKYYKDGVLVGTYSFNFSSTPSRDDCKIGWNNRDTDAPRYYKGKMRQVVFEDKTWTAEEVMSYYNTTKI